MEKISKGVLINPTYSCCQLETVGKSRVARMTGFLVFCQKIGCHDMFFTSKKAVIF